MRAGTWAGSMNGMSSAQVTEKNSPMVIRSGVFRYRYNPPPMALFRRKFRLTACATTGG